MKKILLSACFLFLTIALFSQQVKVEKKGISIIRDDKNKKVDVYFNGVLFTSYIYPTTIEKPVLYPLKTSGGIVVTRGFPLEPRAGERVDHPHHVGWWFNYGDVNGLDFWNNSYAISENEKQHYGSIIHNNIIRAAGGPKEGILTVQTSWVNQKKDVLLNEETTFTFSGDSHNRRIIRTTKLTAFQDVRFGDNKEGMCALRVDRAFELPSDKPEVFTDASGKPTAVPALNNEGVNGIYRSSEGIEKDAVWGTRAKWVSLSAVKENDSVSICLFDHPANFGYPAHWHARGYGLFSLNNIGTKVYNPAEAEVELKLKKGQSITFKHMLLIKSGGFSTDKQLMDEWKAFSRR